MNIKDINKMAGITILVDREVWKKLSMRKIEKGHRSLSQTIEKLLDGEE